MQADISLSQELQEFKNQDPAKKKHHAILKERSTMNIMFYCKKVVLDMWK